MKLIKSENVEFYSLPIRKIEKEELDENEEDSDDSSEEFEKRLVSVDKETKKKMKKERKKIKKERKQQKKLAKIHRHIANQRLDSLHKKSTEIANQYDIVCVESLNMRAMSNKGFGNGKATLDNGYGLFLQMLNYKLLERGKHFVKVDKWYPSSGLCSCCGQQKKLKLTDRIYICSCGLVMDRDQNAAINILREGLRLLREEIA